MKKRYLEKRDVSKQVLDDAVQQVCLRFGCTVFNAFSKAYGASIRTNDNGRRQQPFDLASVQQDARSYALARDRYYQRRNAGAPIIPHYVIAYAEQLRQEAREASQKGRGDQQFFRPPPTRPPQHARR